MHACVSVTATRAPSRESRSACAGAIAARAVLPPLVSGLAAAPGAARRAVALREEALLQPRSYPLEAAVEERLTKMMAASHQSTAEAVAALQRNERALQELCEKGGVSREVLREELGELQKAMEKGFDSVEANAQGPSGCGSPAANTHRPSGCGSPPDGWASQHSSRACAVGHSPSGSAWRLAHECDGS